MSYEERNGVIAELAPKIRKLAEEMATDRDFPCFADELCSFGNSVLVETVMAADNLPQKRIMEKVRDKMGGHIADELEKADMHVPYIPTAAQEGLYDLSRILVDGIDSKNPYSALTMHHERLKAEKKYR